MPNSKTSKASYVSKTRRVTLEKYKILNRDSRKKLKTEKLKKKLKTQEKTQNSRKKLKVREDFSTPEVPSGVKKSLT